MDTFFTNRYYRMIRTFLLIVGIWPYDRTRNSRVRKIFVHVGFVLTILPQILSLATSDLSLKSIIEVSSSLIPSFCIFMSYLSAYCHGKMEIMLEHIKFDWHNIGAGEERGIIEKYANLVRICMMTALVILFAGVFSYILPLTLTYLLDLVVPGNETRMTELPIKVELFIDQQKNFLLLMILTYALGFIIAVTALASYMLYVAYTMHACGMLEVVGYMLRHLFDAEKYNLYTTKDMENITIRLIRCVFFHARTTRYICVINSTYNLSVLIHMFLAFFMVFVAFIRVFYLENIIENMKESIMVVSYIINIFAWMFAYASIGQLMLNKSRELLDNAYAASWYMVPQKMQKLLLMIMINVMRYPSLDIGGIFEVSFNFFTSMTQSAMSYAMVLHSLR